MCIKFLAQCLGDNKPSTDMVYLSLLYTKHYVLLEEHAD